MMISMMSEHRSKWILYEYPRWVSRPDEMDYTICNGSILYTLRFQSYASRVSRTTPLSVGA